MIAQSVRLARIIELGNSWPKHMQALCTFGNYLNCGERDPTRFRWKCRKLLRAMAFTTGSKMNNKRLAEELPAPLKYGKTCLPLFESSL
jgi:hypothetical protein